MVSIVLASHGDLAAGIKQTGSMVFGDQPSVAVVSLEPSMGPDDFRAKVEEAIASFEDQEQVLFLVDLWGGTPFNQISGLIEGHDSWAIVTGVNLPMLIEAYSQRFDAKNTAHAIAKHLVTEAKAGVRVKPESLEPEEKKLFLADMCLEESGLDRLIQACYSLLGLISYLTAGKPEVRAWTIKKGTKAPQAAGKIHSDIERGFIRAETINFDEMMACGGSVAAAKEKGLLRSEGKEYVVKDGDMIYFRFNV
mgnify:CR=1 FL=1